MRKKATSGNGLSFKLKKKARAGFRGGSADLQSNLKDKFFVDVKNLNSNILKLKYKSFNTPVPNFPPVKISDDVKQIIIQIIHNHTNEANKQFNKLSPEDKKLVQKFCSIVDCDIIKEVSDSKEQMMKKYEVLAGEIHAGNDSPVVKQMLKDVVIELFQMKYITKHQYLDVISML